MSILNIRGTGTRRAVDRVSELRDENRRLLTAYHKAGDHVALLQWDLTVARHRQAEAEEIVVKQQADLFDLVEERDQLADEVRHLRAELANATAVDVPPMERDTSAVEDQATAPVPVLTLQQAFGTNPAHVPSWARGTDTQPLPRANPAA